MAGNVDNRVVQMSFENRQFERNIARSKKSLDELKKSMNFDETSKGLDKFSQGLNKLSFSSLETNIQKLTDKFTGLGTASELIISQVRRHIESAAAKLSGFIDSMTTAQVSAGMSKYEMLNKSVQTIKAATGRDEADVYRVLERLNQYTDQTSYNFSDMAQNIGKFTSVGISLEDAERQMEGIANWAARSGAGINEASRAMYNLSQAMGVGKMTLIDWKSIENAGMATKEFKEQLIQAGLAAGTLVDEKGVIKTAKSLGKQVEVTFQNVGQTFNKGWATSKVISNTLEGYYYDDLYYENEQKAILELNDTQKASFNQMIASGSKLEAAEWKQLFNMGVITEDVKQKIVDLAVSQGKLTKETDRDGKTIYKTTNKTGKQIEVTIDRIEESLKAGWFDKGFGESITSINELAKASYESAQKCLTFSDVLGAWKDQISTGWMNSFKHIFGELSESMEFFSNVCNRVGGAIENLIGIRNGALETWSGSGGRDSLLKIILGDYGSNIKTGAVGILDLLEGAGKLVADGFKDFMMLFARPIDKTNVERDPKYFSTYLGYLMTDALKRVQEFLQKIKAFFNGEVEYDGKIKTRLEVIGDVVKGIAGALNLGYNIITKAIEFIGKIGEDMTPGLDAMLEFLADLGKSIYDTANQAGKENQIGNFFTGLRETIKPLTDSVNSLLISFSNLLYTIFGIGEEGATHNEALQSLGNVISSIVKTIVKFASPVINFLSNVITLVNNLFSGKVDAEGITAFGEGVKTSLTNMVNEFPAPVRKIINFFKTLYTNIKNVIQNGFSKKSIQDLFAQVKTSFVSIFETVPEEVKNRVRPVFNKIKTFLTTLYSNVKNVIKTRFGKESVKQLSDQFKNFFNGIFNKVSENLKENGNGVLSKIKAFVSNLWTNITGLFSGREGGEPKENIFERIIGWIKNGFNSFKTFIQTSVGNLEGDTASFFTAIKKLNWSKILMYLFGGLAVAGIATLIAKAIATVKLVAKAIKLVGDILTGEKSIAPTLFGSDDKAESFGDKLLKIAGAVAIFAAAIILIGNMKLENAAQGIGALVIIVGLLVGASFLLKRAYKEVNWQEAAGMFLGMLGMGIAVAAIAKAILPIANISLGGFGKIIGTLVVIFGGLILLSKTAKDGNMSFEKMGGLLGVTAGIAILIFALKGIASMKPEQIATMMITLGIILGELIGFVWAIHKTSLAGKELGQIAALAGAIAILIISLKRIANMKPEQIATMMITLGIILGELIGFVWAIHKTDLSGKSLGQLAALAGAIAILMFALIPLAILPFGRLMQAILAVTIILAELVGATLLLGKGSTTLSGSGLAQLLALAGAVVLISLALLPLSLLDFGKLMGAVLAVTIVLGGLAGMIFIASRCPAKPSSMVGLLAVAGAVVLLVLALTPLALMEWSGLLKMGASLAVITLALMGMLSKVSKVKASAVAATSLLMAAMAIVVLAMGAVMHDIKDVDWKLVASFSVGLGIILGLIGVAVEKFANMDPVKALKGIALLSAAVAAIAAVLGLVISLIGPMIIRSFGSALADVSAYLSLFATLIGDFSTKMSGADNGGLDNAGNVIDKLIDIMRRISAVNQYRGSIADFQTAMFQLGTAVEIFSNHTTSLGSLEGNSAFGLIRGLAECADDLNIITGLPINDLQTKIAGLGGAMSLYAQGAKEATGLEIGETPDVSAALSLMHAISDAFAKDDAEFKLPDNLPENQKITDFGVQLATLSGALVQFSNASQGLGTEYKKGLDVLTFFKDLQRDLKSDEWANVDFGVITEFESELKTNNITKDVLDQFGADIEALGLALNKFATSTSIVDSATNAMVPIDFSSATGALQSFVDIKNDLPEMGGVLQWFSGNRQTLTDLGAEITAAAGALSELSVRITGGSLNGTEYKGFDEGSTQTAIKALGEMADGFNDIETKIDNFPKAKTGDDPYGIASKESSITSLANQISVIGPALNLLSVAITGGTAANGDKYEGFNPDCVEPAQTATASMVTFLQTIQKDLPKVGGLIQIGDTFLHGREGNMEDLKKQLGWLGEGLHSLSTNLGEGFDSEKVKVALESLQSVAAIMATMVNVPEDRVFDGFYMIQELGHFMMGFNGMDLFGNETEVKPIEQIVKAMSSLSDMITQNSIDGDAIGMFLDMATALSELTNTKFDFNFTSVGENIAAGLALGIRNGTSWVTDAAIEVVTAAKNAADKTADNRSPSHVFQRVGEYLSAGLAVGIQNNADLVAEKSGEMVTTALGAVSRALAEGADASPTITPVLDLTNLENGMNEFKRGLAGYGLAVGTSVAVAGVAGFGTGENIPPIASPDYSGIYDRMETLGAQITQMEQSIMKMKLVLDTGVIAGGVSDRVDELIGQKIWLLNRNNSV